MPDHHTLPDILEQVKRGTLDPAVAGQLISSLPVDEAVNLDPNRADCCGIPKVVLTEGKNTGSLVKVMHSYVRAAGRFLASRHSPEQVHAVLTHLPGGITADYREICCILLLSDGTAPAPSGGTVAIVTAGTSDIRVAEEARAITGETGASVLTAYHVDVAGIHRLFPALEKPRDAADIYVAKPVVPINTGYGYVGHG
ncbi:MAG TPA: phosphoribosylaminoimidazole carboxylase, partial [Methanocorpusculum sp.]|nr:phosphoribosylaminoimidazole carboxylase [Methanocorpusculum sp.]